MPRRGISIIPGDWIGVEEALNRLNKAIENLIEESGEINAIQSNPQSGQHRIKGLRLSEGGEIVVTYDGDAES